MSVYEHFRKEEHSFVDKVLEWKEIVNDQYRPKLTDFLDPREQEICKLLVGKNDEVKISFYGGYENAERKRGILYPSYFEPGITDFELAYYEIDYPKKFVQIEHRQVLGALMNVGLKREKFGDIVTDGDTFQFVCDEGVSDFVHMNFTSVGKAKIKLLNISSEDVLPMEQNYEEIQVTVSSLRLDTVISEVYKLSRSQAKPLIESGHVKVNWKVVEDGSYLLMEQDVLSVRKKGRSILLSNEGRTKKDKHRLIIAFPK